MEYMSNLVPTMRAIPQPLIGAINGPAYGEGFGWLGSDGQAEQLTGQAELFAKLARLAN